MCEIDEKGMELLRSLKEEFSSLNFEYRNDVICVDMHGYWVGIAENTTAGDWVVKEEIKSVLPNLIVFNQLEPKLLTEDPVKYRAAYLLVNSPTERIVYDTFDAAWTAKATDGFMDRIGCNDVREEILILGDIEKPPDFDNFNARTIGHIFVAHSGAYYNRTRRWLSVCLQLREGMGFRREHFLLDTGSPKSIMIKEIADNIVSTSTFKGNSIINVEGVMLEFDLQAYNGGDIRTRNINLLGTDFLNNVVLIDDFGSKTIMILKRATSPVGNV